MATTKVLQGVDEHFAGQPPHPSIHCSSSLVFDQTTTVVRIVDGVDRDPAQRALQGAEEVVMGLPRGPPMEDSDSSSLKPSSVVSSVKPGIRQEPYILQPSPTIVDSFSRRPRFTDVKIGSPLINEGSIDLQATPHLCRLLAMGQDNKVRIGRIPIMLRSRQCVLYAKNEAELAQLGALELFICLFCSLLLFSLATDCSSSLLSLHFGF
ncbi:DNA-directed RNA polymerase III subunit 2-like protein [Drosera capensis]